MFFNLSRWSLLVKFSALVIGMTVFAVGIFSIVFFLYEREVGRQAVQDQARSFSVYATTEIYDNYIKSYAHPAPSSFGQFGTLLRAILLANPDVTRVELIAINGRVLFDSFEVDQGKKYGGPERFLIDEELAELVRKDQVTVRDLAEPEGDAVFQVVAPVRAIENVHTISVVYSFSLTSLKAREATLIRRSALTALPLLALGVLLPLFILPSAIRPVRRLKDAAQQVSTGNFDVVIVAETHDEVGALSEAFANMVTELKKSRETLLAKIKELEQLNRVMIGRELRMAELKKEIQQGEGEARS